MAKVPNAVEILRKISTAHRAHERYRRDGRATANTNVKWTSVHVR